VIVRRDETDGDVTRLGALKRIHEVVFRFRTFDRAKHSADLDDRQQRPDQTPVAEDPRSASRALELGDEACEFLRGIDRLSAWWVDRYQQLTAHPRDGGQHIAVEVHLLKGPRTQSRLNSDVECARRRIVPTTTRGSRQRVDKTQQLLHGLCCGLSPWPVQDEPSRCRGADAGRRLRRRPRLQKRLERPPRSNVQVDVPEFSNRCEIDRRGSALCLSHRSWLQRY